MSTAGRDATKEAYIFDYPFLGAYNIAIFEDVLGKVDVGWSSPVFYLLDGLLDVGLGDGHGLWRAQCWREGRSVRVIGRCGWRGSNDGSPWRADVAGQQKKGLYMTTLTNTFQSHHEPKYALRTWFAILKPSRDTT